MLNELFGNKTVAKILPYLHRHEGGNANKIARDLSIPLNMVQKQLERLKKGGILTSYFLGKSKIYQLNKELPFYSPLGKILQVSAGDKAASSQKAPDPADGTELPTRERLAASEQLFRESEILNPYPRPKPFAKSFLSFKEYEKWKKEQSNPWLL